MKNIEVTKQFMIGGTIIDEIKVAPITFIPYVEMVEKTVNRATKGAKIKQLIHRDRIKEQVHFLSKGKRIVADDPAISQIPVRTALAIAAAFEEGLGEDGEIISDGDGIDKPVLYKLGNPIPVAGSNTTPITELEFMAKTYGDIEDVLSIEGAMSQAAAFIRQVGKPANSPSLLALPDWALRQITVADGVAISRDILPRFLG